MPSPLQFEALHTVALIALRSARPKKSERARIFARLYSDSFLSGFCTPLVSQQRFAPMLRVTALILLRGALASDCDTDDYYADVDLTLTGSALRAAYTRESSRHTP